ncbi:hypothetical protein [Chelativorans sp. AA-79]|uniref:hypothetical protein n=1 Tax=Chelativorans sp. AA-79 TaxID=3028735 RepID=UPI0023F6638E|nr:hypothetical protein [Chelativorans sp. AA-79]WEX09229.1 hypothetical protein PVE73_24895 [Chelativorans sp. AA-79]
MAHMFSSQELQPTRWSRRFARGATPSAIDIPVSSAYLSSMFARVVSILAIVGVAVMMMAFSAHAARMSITSDHAAHLNEMMNSAAGIEPACSSEHCGSAGMDAGTCEVVCAGFSLFLISPSGDSGNQYTPARHVLPPDASTAGRAPGLNERPPKIRLL